MLFSPPAGQGCGMSGPLPSPAQLTKLAARWRAVTALHSDIKLHVWHAPAGVVTATSSCLTLLLPVLQCCASHSI